MSSARSIAAMASLPQCSAACGTADGMSRMTFSLATDVGLLDDLAPFRVVLANQLREVFRGIGEHLNALRRELRLDLGAGEDARHLGVHLLHDVRRYLRRHEEAEPGVDRVAWQRLADRRRIAEVREALRRRAAEELELAFLDVRQERIGGADPHLDAARQQIRDGR